MYFRTSDQGCGILERPERENPQNQQRSVNAGRRYGGNDIGGLGQDRHGIVFPEAWIDVVHGPVIAFGPVSHKQPAQVAELEFIRYRIGRGVDVVVGIMPEGRKDGQDNQKAYKTDTIHIADLSSGFVYPSKIGQAIKHPRKQTLCQR